MLRRPSRGKADKGYHSSEDSGVHGQKHRSKLFKQNKNMISAVGRMTVVDRIPQSRGNENRILPTGDRDMNGYLDTRI